MIKKILPIFLLLLVPFLVFAAVTDFVANSNIAVPGVTFGAGTANMIIMSGSTAESWSFNSGALTVTNPGAAFNVASSDSAVKSIQVTSGGTTLACVENTTPGTSFATLPTTSGTYTTIPSATTVCTSLCTVLPNTASYNSFPTCGALTCNAGYQISGSGASATCIAVPAGGVPISLITCKTGYIFGQTTYGGWSCIPIPTTTTTPTPAVATTPLSVAQPSGMKTATFLKNLFPGMKSNDVSRLQNLLASDKDVYPEGIVSGFYGKLTKKAVGRFQIKYGVVSSTSTPGYGNVGPLTRAKLKIVFGK